MNSSKEREEIRNKQNVKNKSSLSVSSAPLSMGITDFI